MIHALPLPYVHTYLPQTPSSALLRFPSHTLFRITSSSEAPFSTYKQISPKSVSVSCISLMGAIPYLCLQFPNEPLYLGHMTYLLISTGRIYRLVSALTGRAFAIADIQYFETYPCPQSFQNYHVPSFSS